MTVTAPDPLSLFSRLRSVWAWKDTKVLCLVFLTTQLLDVISTHRALASARFEEGNPWLADMTNNHPLVVFGAKLLAAVLVLIVLLSLRLRWRLRRAVLTLFAVASLVAPVTNTLKLAGYL
ncbi:MAG TPA: DUF5658 family protein [Candidatus Dormibacteraeota bacterium]|nr:DUF5658 family protein [Candidatus Dormibacteraeota bacterium]